MKIGSLVNRREVVPYLAAAWVGLVVLGVTLFVQSLGPEPQEPTVQTLFRLGGGWLALLAAVLVWVVVSEPLRLQERVEDATQKLKASEQRFRRLYDQAPLAYLTLDHEGRIDRVNARFEELLGYQADDVHGERFPELFEEGTDSQAKAGKLVQRILNGESVEGEELSIRTADGEQRWITVTIRSIPEEGPGKARFLSMVMDLTERRKAEDQLEFYAEELERSNEDLQRFASVASHDLRDPLRVIRMHLDLLEERYREQIPEEAHEHVDQAIAGADRMEALIDSLLRYSRLDTEGVPDERVDLNEVVEDVREDLGVRIDRTGADLEVGQLPEVRGEAAQLRQLVQNLVENALKYGGEEPQVRIDADRSQDGWQVRVEDDGPGIPEEQHGSVFEVFERLDAHEEGEGMGMGLAICQRIAERHGGDVRIQDGELGGACFAVDLPAGTGPASTAPDEVAGDAR